MSADCPPDVLGWIAWYPEGGLSDEQRGAVEAHAAGCAACRDELAMLEGAAEPEVDAPDPARLLESIWQRVDAAEEPAEPSPRRRSARADRPPARPMASRRSPLAVAAALLIAALAGWMAASLTGAPTYRTASAPGSVDAAGAVAQLDVVFANDASVATANALLQSLDAEIIAGPSAVGRYRVRIPSGAEPADFAARLRREGGGVVLLAEPALP